MELDFEKMLRAYLRHVASCEGVTFTGERYASPDGLTEAEAAWLLQEGRRAENDWCPSEHGKGTSELLGPRRDLESYQKP